MRKILHADQRPKQNHKKREPAGCSPRTVPNRKRISTDVKPGKHSFSDYEVSKKVVYLLRHSQHVHREKHGAVQFWRMKEHLQENSCIPLITGCCSELDIFVPNLMCGFGGHFGGHDGGWRLWAVLDILEVTGRASGRTRCLKKTRF